MTTIYLSSPYEDLKAHRRAVYDALRRSGCAVIAMEDYVARDARVMDRCLADIRDSADIYVGLVAFRYGSIPPKEHVTTYFGDTDPSRWLGLSITEIEYRYAQDVTRIPCLTFVAREDALWNPDHIDAYAERNDPHPGRRVDSFRSHLLSERMSSTFSSPMELASLVQAAVMRELADKPIQRPTPNVVHRWSVERDGSPFPGLLRFTARLAPVYFGREKEVRDVTDIITSGPAHVTLISGESGSGKSSLVEAGVLPALRDSASASSQRLRLARMQPSQGNNPIEALMRALHEEVTNAGFDPLRLERSVRSEPSMLRRALEAVTPQDSAEIALLLFVDQLEEAFARTLAPATDTLIACLAEIATLPSVRVVTTVRADLLHHCFRYEPLLEATRQGCHYPLGSVDLTSLIDMVRKPAEASGLTLSDGLISRIVQDVGLGPGRLPILGFVLEQLFLRRDGVHLHENAYKSLGGAEGAIAAIVERATADLASVALEHSSVPLKLEQIFPLLVQLDMEGEPIRKRAIKQGLEAAAQQIADALIRSRLLAVDGAGAATEVFFAHEKLFTAWPALEKWIAEHRESMLLIQYADVQAREWEAHNFDPVYLWHVDRLQSLRKAIRNLDQEQTPARAHRFAYPQDRLISRLEGHISHEERWTIGTYLSSLGDPRVGVGVRADGLPDVSWCSVPAGSVALEGNRGSSLVSESRIARYPVTWDQYKTFIDAPDGFAEDAWWEGLQVREPTPGVQYRQLGNHPAENVSWHDAVAFCRWLSHRLGYEVRLPNEFEWLQALTGGAENMTWPWGPDWSSDRANLNESNLGRTTAVGVYPGGNASTGVADMIGNVWEWCINTHDDPLVADFASTVDRSIRGGSWYLSRFGPRTVIRAYRPSGRDYAIGFRLYAPLSRPSVRATDQ